MKLLVGWMWRLIAKDLQGRPNYGRLRSKHWRWQSDAYVWF